MKRATPANLALAVFAIALATIVGAWAFEAAGYLPCELCLKQRVAYYAGVPLAGLVALIAMRGPDAPLAGVVGAGFLGLALIFAANGVLASTIPASNGGSGRGQANAPATSRDRLAAICWSSSRP